MCVRAKSSSKIYSTIWTRTIPMVYIIYLLSISFCSTHALPSVGSGNNSFAGSICCENRLENYLNHPVNLDLMFDKYMLGFRVLLRYSNIICYWCIVNTPAVATARGWYDACVLCIHNNIVCIVMNFELDRKTKREKDIISKRFYETVNLPRVWHRYLLFFFLHQYKINLEDIFIYSTKN